MAHHWVTAGHRVTVLAGMMHYSRGRKYDYCRGRYLIDEAPEPNVRVLRTHVSSLYNRSWAGRLWAYITYFFTSLWAGLFRAGRDFDAVVVTSPPLLIGLTGWLLACWFQKPLVFEVRDLWPDAPVQMGVLTNASAIRAAYWLERFLYQQAQHIVVLTPGYCDWLVAQKQVSLTKITVIPNAADFDLADSLALAFDRTAFRQAHQMNDGAFWVIYAGAHSLVNRLAVVLEAANRLRDEEDIQFLLIGDGTVKADLQQQAQTLNLTNVRFLDSLSKVDALRFMLASDAGLATAQHLPVFRTVFAGKMFDYFSCRVPVLMVIDGVSRGVIETAQAGLFVEPENPDDMARQIRWYAQHRQQAQQHGQNGYNFAKAHYDRAVLANDYLNLLYHVSDIWQTTH